MRSRRGRGSATVYATILICLLTTLAVVAAAAGSLFVGHRRAAAAADLAALAGAAAQQRGDPGCQVAGRIAAENGAELAGCDTTGEVLTLRVSLRVPVVFRSTVEVHARARAGPVS